MIKGVLVWPSRNSRHLSLYGYAQPKFTAGQRSSPHAPAFTM